MDFKERLKACRLQKGYTLKYVADAVGVTEATVQRWESGNIKSLRHVRIAKLTEVLGVPPGYLMGWEDEQSFGPSIYPAPIVTDDTVTFPVIGDVAAGFEQIAIENWEGETIEIPASYLRGRPASDYIALRVCGDSMFPFYLDGDTVLVLRTPTLDHSGQVGLVRYEGEMATLKKVEYVVGEDWMRLIPLNAMYPPRTIKGADLEQCSVIGIPKLLIREVEE